MKRLFAALALALCLYIAPTALASSNARPAAVRTTATPSDAQIDATIRAKLAKSKIGKDGFRFKVARGIVTWEGTTNVVQHKGSATRMARAAGAVQVVNNIQVSAAAKAKAGANLKRATVQ
jgi:CubicO group peptidase (beta-lactamase class C family)